MICSAMVQSLSAQFPGGGPGGARRGAGQMNIGRFYGRIVDKATNKGIEAASVQLLQSRLDSVTKQRKEAVVGGMLTKPNGDFSIENLPLFGQYKLLITAIGYKPIEQKVAFNIKMGPGQDMQQVMQAVDKDLGNIKMEMDASVLADVTVTGSKPLIQMGIDRKIFNVEKSITSTGGSAVDVMRNVPSINVDIDGNLTLRNSAPQIFVDGRPTTLSLDQIPADAIQSIEIITNPSAKYDASGGQSGILNIVLKKNRKAGYNGSVRAGVDSRGRFNGGGDINVRQGKVNVFANGMYNQRKSKGWGATDRLSLDNPPMLTHQDNKGVFNGAFAFARFGIDYFMDNRNTITLSQSIVNGDFEGDNRNNYLLQNGSISETQFRNSFTDNNFRNYGTQLSYKHLFAKAGKELTADLNLNQSRNSNLNNIYFGSSKDAPGQDPGLQRIDGGGKNRFLVGQIDYVNPITDDIKWEAGARAQVRNFESFQHNYLNGTFNPAISNDFEYTDRVYAAYATFSQKIRDSFSYQIGLRAESSGYDGTQIGKQNFKVDYPISLFPSIFLSRTLRNKQDIQLNYTRRINRPNFFQLMPNTDYSDPLNFQTGNPGLKPEFTNSLELSYQKNYGAKNHTFLATLFGKYTTNLISRYWDTVSKGPDSAFSTWVNANTAYAGGLELISRNPLFKWWDMTVSTNIYYSRINSDNVAEGLKNDRTSWSAKMNHQFRFNKGWSLQLSGDYTAKSALPVSTSNSGGGGGRGFGGGGFGGGQPSTTQGYINAIYGVDLGLRKDFQIKKNTLTASVNWSDILRTRKFSMHSEAPTFIQDDWRRRDPQIVRVNLSYRFGKFDAALFKRKNMRGDQEGMQNGMQGMGQ
jgi:Outer membrane receptor proteins, mostly Fe transport